LNKLCKGKSKFELCQRGGDIQPLSTRYDVYHLCYRPDVTCVSLVTGNLDILSACVFRETTDLFNIIESVKMIQKVDKVSWAEEVHDIPTKEITMSFRESINTSAAISENVQMTN
jgi:hypothetical protein